MFILIRYKNLFEIINGLIIFGYSFIWIYIFTKNKYLIVLRNLQCLKNQTIEDEDNENDYYGELFLF